MNRISLLFFVLVFFETSVWTQTSTEVETDSHRFSLNLISGIGFMKPQSHFTSDEYIGEIVPKTSEMIEFGIETEYFLNSQLSIYSGLLLHRKTYKQGFPSGSTSKSFAYSFTFPIFARYYLNKENTSPYFSFGAYYSLQDEDPSFASFTTQKGINIRHSQPIERNAFSVGFEIGKRIFFKGANLSYSIHYNYEWEQSFTSEYEDVNLESILERRVGYGTSNGSAIGLRLKYNFGLKSEETKHSPSNVELNPVNNASNKNYIVLDILGASRFYALSYERFLYRKNWIHFSLKSGLSYIPDYNEGEVYVNPAFRESTKLQGLFLPNVINLYIGSNKSFIHLGQAATFTYSPYNFPEFHDKDFGWSTYLVSIVGYRYESHKWAFNGQLNFQLSSPVPFGGISIARRINSKD